MLERMRKIRGNALFLGCMTVVFFVLCFIMCAAPYCHDDWKWGSLNERLENMTNLWYGYNGRVLGNMLVLSLTRFGNGMKTLIMVSNVVLLVFVIYITGINMNSYISEPQSFHMSNKSIMVIEIVLLFLLPKAIWAQVYGWPAGFANYLPPMIFFCLFLRETLNIYFEENIKDDWKLAIKFFLIGLIATLFAEHTTISFLV